MGLGASASRHLVKGIARVGNGTAVFAGEREDLRSKVMGQLKNALQPTLHQVKISWEDTSMTQQATNSKADVELETKKTLLGFMKPKKPIGKEQTKIDARNIYLSGQVPCKLPPIFDGTRLLAYHIYEKQTAIPKVIKITAETPSGPLSVDVNILTSNILEEGDFVHKIAARKKIQELQETILGNNNDDTDTSDVKKAIIQIGLEHGLASRYTSFVGIDGNSGKVLDHYPMLTRNIKNQIPSGFGGTRQLAYRRTMSKLYERNYCVQYCVPPQSRQGKKIRFLESNPNIQI